MNTDHPTVGGERVAFVVSDELAIALDRAAAENGETRSHLARRIVARHLLEAGAFPQEAPMTRQGARQAARRQRIAEKRDRLAARARA